MKKLNLNSKWLALDIETKAQEGRPKDDALNFHRNIITIGAVSDGETGEVVRSLEEWSKYSQCLFVTHGGKFDFKNLKKHGAPVEWNQYAHDTLLMATTLAEKIPETWLEEYDQYRISLNKEAKKQVHRQAGKHSLKTLAPYFLGVDPFWETEDHDNEEYVIKDALYTAQLAEVLEQKLKTQGGWDFYNNYLLPWNRMLMQAEYRGTQINFDTLREFEIQYKQLSDEAEATLKRVWAPYYEKYNTLQVEKVYTETQQKKAIALAKLAPSKKKDPEKAAREDFEKRSKCSARYELAAIDKIKKIKPLNLASPIQLKWLLKDCMNLDVTTFDGKNESTGKAILERLAKEEVQGIPEFMEYRKANKLVTAFFPSYREEAIDKIIHTTYNVDVARTGRLSSQSPNLQQISKKILPLFEARKGYKLIYRDVSAVEPRLIAYTTECQVLCDIFLNGSDFHSENVRAMLGIQEDDATIKKQYKPERDLAKEVGLALMYGAMHKRIQECAAKRGFNWTEKECKRMYRAFQDKYEEVWEYKRQLEAAIVRGEPIFNLFGRPLNFDLDRLHMQSLNTQIQSGGSDILLASICDAVNKCAERNIEAHPLLFIHDASAIEAPEAVANEVDKIVVDTISSWKLPTKWGNIPMMSEGAIVTRMGAE